MAVTGIQKTQRRLDSEWEAQCRRIDYENAVIRPPGADRKPYPPRPIATNSTLLDTQRRQREIEYPRQQLRNHQIHNVLENRRGHLDIVTMRSENGGSPARDARGFFARDTAAPQRDPNRLDAAVAALVSVGHSLDDARRIALREDPTAADDHRAGRVNTMRGSAQLRWADLVEQEARRLMAAEGLEYIVAYRKAGATLSAQRPDLYAEYRADVVDADDIGGW